MRIVYFLSSNYPYETLIYPGVGPRFPRVFGWPTAPISAILHSQCDVGIVDARLTPDDFRQLDAFLAAAKPAFPLLFRLSDPDMPTYRDEADRYVFRQRDLPGVHYVSIYEPRGPLLEFVGSLCRSRVVRLPYPFDAARQVERDFSRRRRRILLSGAQSALLYPLRYGLHKKRRWNPLVRWLVSELPHPGYPESGKPPRHSLIQERYIDYAAGFTHFFLCPLRYRVELMKYVECVYAGCVPMGQPPDSLADHVSHCFVRYSGRTGELWRATSAKSAEMSAMAVEYRRVLRTVRDPVKLHAELEEQLLAIL